MPYTGKLVIFLFLGIAFSGLLMWLIMGVATLNKLRGRLEETEKDVNALGAKCRNLESLIKSECGRLSLKIHSFDRRIKEFESKNERSENSDFWG